MGLTRFYSRETGMDGPVSGALQMIPIVFNAVAANSVVAWTTSPPAGMQFEIVGADCYATSVTSTPELTIGLTEAETHIVSAVEVTATLGALTLKTTTAVTSGDVLDVRITPGAAEAAQAVAVTLYAYVSAAPTSLLR